MKNFILQEKIWQCAWCGAIMLNHRKIGESKELIELSHGLCEDCCNVMFEGDIEAEGLRNKGMKSDEAGFTQEEILSVKKL